LQYSGKIDTKAPADASGAHLGGHTVETIHAHQAPADAIIIPEAQLLFHGDFKRSGVDLVLSGDGRELVLHDYFKGEKYAPLASPDGAHLTGDLVNALAGQVQYAQAGGNAATNQVIGHVTKLAGTATAIRNGVSIILNNGDNVEKGDVVTSGSNSTLGITFIDGTVFGLSSNARMVLNEMVYDPNASNNSSLLSLVAGTITFVAGETAKHGDMKIDTPVATMGIRGTAVLVEIDFSVPGQGTPDAKFQVLVEPDGTTGSYILFDKTTLTPLAVVDHAGLQVNISNGIMSQTLTPLSPEIQQLINDVFSLKFTDNTNTKSLQNFTDTITPQALEPIKLASGDSATPVVLFTTPTTNLSPSPPTNGPTFVPFTHIDQPTSVVVSGNAALTAHSGASQSTGVDSVSGTIRFADINAGDLPTASANFVSLKLSDAEHNDITATLTSQQIAAVAAQLVVTPSAGNNNNGSATWTYGVADTAFNFLTAGETLTLTYDAMVNNNYTPLDQVSTDPFTITINALGSVEWIHPTGGLWSVGSNWSSGTVPTAADDAIIPAQNISGGSGLYDVIIQTPAVARNLTLNANDTTGGQVTNDSTLTIGEVLTVFNNGVLDNSGIVSIGQKIELLNQSSLLNFGQITLGQGGDFEGSSSVVNFGTIEVAGGTLNVQVDITNSGGVINVDDGAMLTLSGTTIYGGTIYDGTAAGTSSPVFGSIDVTGSSTISDGSLNGGGVTVASSVTLTLDNDTVNGTTFTATGATIQIDDGAVLTLAGSTTINGGTINDGTSGTTGDSVFGSIDVTGPTKISNASVNNGEVTVASGVVLTLDNDTVSGTTFSDTASGATIQIDDGTVLTLTGNVTINGGTIDNGTASGTGTPAVFGGIDVIGPSTISNVFLNNGEVTVASAVTLTLSNDTVTGTTFNDAQGGGGGLEPNGIADSGSSAGTIDISGAVTFQSGVEVNGDAMSVAKGATLDIENPVTGIGATLNGVDVTNSGAIQVDTPGPGTTIITLVLDDGTSVTGGTLLVDSGFPIGGIEGTVEVGTGGATLDSVTVENKNLITVDGGAALDLIGTTIDGGTLGGAGTIAIGSGVSSFDNIAIDALATVEVNDNSGLELIGTIANDGLIALTSSADTTQLEISGDVLLEGSGQLVLSDSSLNHIVSDGSTATLTNSETISGAGTIGDAFLILVNDGTIDATGTNPLMIDSGAVSASDGNQWSVGNFAVLNNNTGVLEASAGHVLQIDDNVQNDGIIQAGGVGGDSIALVSIAGGITGSGSIDIFDNGKVEVGGSVSSGQTVTFESSGGGELILDNPQDFQGLIKLLVPAAAEGTENYIDLKGISYNVDMKVVPGIFDPTTDITSVTIFDGNSANSLTINVIGDYQGGDIRFADDGAGGTLISDPTIGSAATINSGTTLEIGGVSAATVSFANNHGSTGELVLDESSAFTGQIAGFAGNGSVSGSDLVDLTDVDIASVAMDKTSYTPNGNGTGTLTLYNANGHALDHITFDGSYQLANFTIENDGSGHPLIVDPPTSSGANANSSVVPDDAGPAVNAVGMHDPGPPATGTTVVAAAQIHTPSSLGASDNFAFNFKDTGHITMTDFHSLTENPLFGNSAFASIQAILNATHDDSRGNTVTALDGHDGIDSNNVHKTVPHIGDFHVG
jgi:FecR-like protein